MNLLGAYQQLKQLEPVFFTKEAAMVLGVSDKYAAIILSRLEKQKAIVHLARGRWAYSNKVDPLYLIPAKSNLFKRLTELELPVDFNFSLFKPWLKQINNKSRRKMVETSLDEIRTWLSY